MRWQNQCFSGSLMKGKLNRFSLRSQK